jgi:GNAT superfamily N-acetyltransferase
MSLQPQRAAVSIRPMTERDIPDARRICQLAFGTFIGVPNPATFWEDRDYARTRWAGKLGAPFVAEADGQIVGSNFASNWGSFGFFGPLTVHPDHWNQGVAQKLLAPTVETFRSWGVRHSGLFTFAQSAKHVGLYQKFGFWPRFLTAIMTKPSESKAISWSEFSTLDADGRNETLAACRELTNSIFEGLDVSREIQAIHRLKLGDTLLLWSGDVLDGFACCHCGPGTEAGGNTCYIKFGAVRRAASSGQMFDRLLDACETFAAERGLARVEAGTNLGREDAFRKMRARGYQTTIQGVAMHQPNESAFSNPTDYVIDDWR